MKIGILGSGDVGQSLGEGFAGKGHDVKIGSRTPDKAELKEGIKKTKGKVSTGTFAEAARHGELLLLCTLGQAAEAVVHTAGEGNFEGKVLIDVTNPLAFSKGVSPGPLLGAPGAP